MYLGKDNFMTLQENIIYIKPYAHNNAVWIISSQKHITIKMCGERLLAVPSADSVE